MHKEKKKKEIEKRRSIIRKQEIRFKKERRPFGPPLNFFSFVYNI
jgi:hypothetical protein